MQHTFLQQTKLWWDTLKLVSLEKSKDSKMNNLCCQLGLDLESTKRWGPVHICGGLSWFTWTDVRTPPWREVALPVLSQTNRRQRENFGYFACSSFFILLESASTLFSSTFTSLLTSSTILHRYQFSHGNCGPEMLQESFSTRLGLPKHTTSRMKHLVHSLSRVKAPILGYPYSIL